MGEYADDALNQSMDEWLEEMESDDPESDWWVGYRRAPRKPKPEGPGPCPRCSKDTVLRTGKYGSFYGCSTFPKCKGTRKA